MAAQFNQNFELVGMNSYSVAVPNAAPYTMDWKILIPTITNGGGQSSVVVTITDTTTSTTLFTGTAGAQGGSFVFAAAANDVITFAMSSANPNDTALNAVKATVALSQGVN